MDNCQILAKFRCAIRTLLNSALIYDGRQTKHLTSESLGRTFDLTDKFDIKPSSTCKIETH